MRRTSTALAMAGGLCCAALHAQPASCGAESRNPQVQSALGVETVNARNGNAALELRLLRLAPKEWATGVVDMRQLRQMKAQQRSYTAPSYSLAELARVVGADRILASAGMTDSLASPVPVGLLKSSGVVRNQANTASRILDGVLCVRGDRSVRLLSQLTPAGRRIPQSWTAATASCTHAVQAGPMLVDKGQPLPVRGPLSSSRVFAAVDRQGRLVLGHAPQATTHDLACALAAPALGIEQAIGLQGDELGGVLIGTRAGPGAGKWGQDASTLASALEIVRRRP